MFLIFTLPNAKCSTDVKNIFAPLITDILRLINEQVKEVLIKRPGQGVTGIFLVGGFGGSQYLKSCVENDQPDIQVLQPSDAWSAIVKYANSHSTVFKLTS
jgi:hypothetical protein